MKIWYTENEKNVKKFDYEWKFDTQKTKRIWMRYFIVGRCDSFVGGTAATAFIPWNGADRAAGHRQRRRGHSDQKTHLQTTVQNCAASRHPDHQQRRPVAG